MGLKRGIQRKERKRCTRKQLTAKEECHPQVDGKLKSCLEQLVLDDLTKHRTSHLRHVPRMAHLLLMLLYIDIGLLMLIAMLLAHKTLLVNDRRPLDRTKDLNRNLAHFPPDHHRVQPFCIPFPSTDVQVQVPGAGTLEVGPGDEVHHHLVVPADVKGDGLVKLVKGDDAVGVARRVCEFDGFAFGEDVAGWATAVDDSAED